MEEEIKSLPDVAKRVFLDCKKCECGRYHVVVAHLTKSSAKVECEVCKSKKTFKLEKPKKTLAEKAKTKSARIAKAAPAKQMDKFTELKGKFGSGNILPYKMTVSFTLNSAIDHPKFGLGIVTEVGSNSIQVTFQDLDRSLVHGRH